MATPGKVSYRQVGKNKKGRVVTGPPPEITNFASNNNGHNVPRSGLGGSAPAGLVGQAPAAARAKRGPASIPSKFETTLHPGQRESHAFGNRTVRFTDNERDVPGPGNYHRSSSYIRSAETCGSVSHKGFGVGFVSKTNRFSDRGALEQRFMPGPGQYRGPSTRVIERHDFSQAPTSGLFARPRHYRDEQSLPVGLASQPGPGEYDPLSASKRLERGGHRSTHSSMFKSETKRGRHVMAHDGPAPNAYHPRPIDAQEQNAGHASSSFKSSTVRSKTRDLSGLPGPGHYNPREPSNANANDASAAGGSVAGGGGGGGGRDGEAMGPAGAAAAAAAAAEAAAAAAGPATTRDGPAFGSSPPGLDGTGRGGGGGGGPMIRGPQAGGHVFAAGWQRADQRGNYSSSMFSNKGQDRFGRPYLKRSTMDQGPGPGAYVDRSDDNRRAVKAPASSRCVSRPFPEAVQLVAFVLRAACEAL